MHITLLQGKTTVTVFLRKLSICAAEHRMVVLLHASRASVTRAKRQKQGTETIK